MTGLRPIPDIDGVSEVHESRLRIYDIYNETIWGS